MNVQLEVKPKQYKKVPKSILTNREIEYLSLAALGLRNPKIGIILCVSTSTVKKTFETIFQKLKAKDRTNAVTIAFIHHILELSVINQIIERYNIDYEFKTLPSKQVKSRPL